MEKTVSFPGAGAKRGPKGRGTFAVSWTRTLTVCVWSLLLVFAAVVSFAQVAKMPPFGRAELVGERVDVGWIDRCSASHGSFCVVDGDTVRYRGQKIRVSDYNTPEVFSPACAHKLALGRRATERLVLLLNDGPFDIVDLGRGRDRYGRLLRELRRNGQSLGDVLIAEGLAHRWRGYKQNWCA